MSRATELADDITPTAEHVPGLREMLDAAAELRRLDRVKAELVEALTRLLQNFPTDGDMAEAGWEGLEIEAACQAYDRARAALTSAKGDAQ